MGLVRSVNFLGLEMSTMEIVRDEKKFEKFQLPTLKFWSPSNLQKMYFENSTTWRNSTKLYRTSYENI